VLDTELFGCQTPERCMERLGLAVTDPGDLPFVYQALSRLRAPDAPTDDYEVVTGVFPLPLGADGNSARWRTQTTRRVAGTPDPAAVLTLDWRGALHLHSALDAGERDGRRQMVPAIRTLVDDQFSAEAYHGLHLAVVGSCEGEAALLARWTHTHRAEIEEALRLQVVSISWLASDIAPVGWMPVGFLQPCVVSTRTWVVIAAESRLRHCEVTGHLIEMMRSLGRPYGELAIDRETDNLRWYDERQAQEQDDSLATYPIAEGLFRQHRGGLFRGALVDYLLPAGRRIPS